MQRPVVWTAGVVLAVVALLVAALVGAAVGFALGTGLRPLGDAGERVVAGEGADKVALVRVVGAISQEGGGLLSFGPVASSRRVLEQLERARRDRAVKAVVVELNTPGGSVVASAQIHDKLVELRRAGKPVVALLTEVAASGGYYVAAGADRVVADPSTLTGSIGVIVVLPNLQEFNRRIGLRTVVFKSGRFKDMGNPDRSLTQEEAKLFQGIVDEAYRRFVDVVVQGRRMERSRVLQLADGRIYTGAQAQRLGLVDRLGSLQEAVSEALQLARIPRARVVEYTGGGWLGTLLGLRGPGTQRGWVPEAQPFSLQYLMAP
ncbi:MAG: signal peptide peptidase SppA [Armatimonadota bacterium]|nr:signal peptide peptidase SppA [Armatimonadota bacterium]